MAPTTAVSRRRSSSGSSSGRKPVLSHSRPTTTAPAHDGRAGHEARDAEGREPPRGADRQSGHGEGDQEPRRTPSRAAVRSRRRRDQRPHSHAAQGDHDPAPDTHGRRHRPGLGEQHRDCPETGCQGEDQGGSGMPRSVEGAGAGRSPCRRPPARGRPNAATRSTSVLPPERATAHPRTSAGTRLFREQGPPRSGGRSLVEQHATHQGRDRPAGHQGEGVGTVGGDPGHGRGGCAHAEADRGDQHLDRDSPRRKAAFPTRTRPHSTAWGTARGQG